MNTDRILLHDLERRVRQETPWSVAIAQRSGSGRPDRFLGDVRRVYQLLGDVAYRAGVPVHQVDAPYPGVPPASEGWFHFDPTEPPYIGIVTPGRSLEAQARTLLHEEGHLFTENLRLYERDDAEIVAEAASWIVAQQLGFTDGDSYSSAYISGWGELRGRTLRDLELPILRTAARLGDAIEREVSFDWRAA